jgi:sulfur-oxidizing protein SoxY
MRTRREFLSTAGAIGLALAVKPVAATQVALNDAIRSLTGGAEVRTGRVQIDLPPLTESGHAVPLSVRVASPMTAADYVRSIHVLAQKNPQPYIVSAYLGARAGRAQLSTRVRLADTQTVTAIAQLSDGSFWSGTAHVVVTLAACLEEL